MPTSGCEQTEVSTQNPQNDKSRLFRREMISVDPEQFIAADAERVALVINVSGDKDSIRMFGYLRSGFPQVSVYCVMADTGFKHVRPVPAVEWSRQIAARFGSTLEVVRNPNKIYLQWFVRVASSLRHSSGSVRATWNAARYRSSSVACLLKC